MLRFLVGLVLLVSAVALARGDSGLPNLATRLEEFLHPRQPTEEEIEQRRQEEENWKREARNDRELKHELFEQERSLAQAGPTFGVRSFGGGLMGSPLLSACLIGGTGKIYLYDPVNGAAPADGVVDERAFSKAADLAKSVGHMKWRPASMTADFGYAVWTMTFDGQTTLLQVIGDYLGGHPDPRAGELVKLIGGWCPYTPEIMSWLKLWQTESGLTLSPFDRLMGCQYSRGHGRSTYCRN